jgi:hypothetical protein
LKKTTFYITEENTELLKVIGFLKNESKTNLVNSAIKEYLNKIIEIDNLKEKIENLNK